MTISGVKDMLGVSCFLLKGFGLGSTTYVFDIQ